MEGIMEGVKAVRSLGGFRVKAFGEVTALPALPG